MAPLLEARSLVKVFPGIRAVDGISFSVERGRCFGLLGPNGAGKTTTLEMLEGISRPASGEILYEGRELDREGEEAQQAELATVVPAGLELSRAEVVGLLDRGGDRPGLARIEDEHGKGSCKERRECRRNYPGARGLQGGPPAHPRLR